MAKDRFVEVYSQGLTNVEKIIVDKETGVNYLLAASTLTAGCGMSVLVDQNGKPIVTPVNSKAADCISIHPVCLSESKKHISLPDNPRRCGIQVHTRCGKMNREAKL